LEPATGTAELADRLGIEIDDNGFFDSIDIKMDPVTTIIPGIYIAGTATAPKDIPDSVAQGQAAAMRAFTDAIRAG
jgi:heterodisulfide reductase subunit A